MINLRKGLDQLLERLGLEPEVALLPQLCDRAKTSIDVGAANGIYASRLILYSCKVVAFEPRPVAAAHLRDLFCRSGIVSVEQVALSNVAASTTMRIPVEGQLATIEYNNTLAGAPSLAVLTVTTRRLDDYNFRSVGFIKVDTEGHEAAVLKGAKDTIERERPVLLIEIEERHKPGSLTEVPEFLAALRYEGFFFLNRQLRPIREFNAEKHQAVQNVDANGKRLGLYINNFIFAPMEVKL